jgi:hypothetical protein
MPAARDALLLRREKSSWNGAATATAQPAARQRTAFARISAYLASTADPGPRAVDRAARRDTWSVAAEALRPAKASLSGSTMPRCFADACRASQARSLLVVRLIG